MIRATLTMKSGERVAVTVDDEEYLSMVRSFSSFTHSDKTSGFGGIDDRSVAYFINFSEVAAITGLTVREGRA